MKKLKDQGVRDIEKNGEVIVLRNSGGSIVSSVDYNDRAPWSVLADGAGPSLELRCASAVLDDADSWIASPPSVDRDPHRETSGTPAAPNTFLSCPAIKPRMPRVVISEVMYKPVKEEGEDDSHEYFELFNADSKAINIYNWRMVSARGQLRYTVLPTGVNNEQVWLAPGAHAIFSQDPTWFAAQYPSYSGALYGPYAGELGNGGDKLAVLTDSGFEVDALVYDDKFPWPLAADGLSVDDDYVAVAGDPLPSADWKGLT